MNDTYAKMHLRLCHKCILTWNCLNKPIELKVAQSYELHTVFQTTENSIMAYVYFDWNAEGDFSDAEESILISNNPGNNPCKEYKT